MKLKNFTGICTSLLLSIFIAVLQFDNSLIQASDLPSKLVASKHRFQALLDGNTFVDVDNASHMPDELVHNLVLAADRSTSDRMPLQ